jgi:hypothetical protein
MLKIFRTAYLAIAWFIVIHVLTLVPFKSNPDTNLNFFPNIDKLVHFGLFFILCFLWGTYFFSKKDLSQQAKNKWFFILPLLAILDGIGIEFLQKLPVIHRDFEWFDALADGIGAVAGILFAKIIAKKFWS